jgi:hypothetical protein
VTFATHWKHHFLQPGATSMAVGSNPRKLTYVDPDGVAHTIRFEANADDLVFYVPAQAVDDRQNFLGLAYDDGREIIALCPQTHWGPKIPPPYWTG